MSFEFKFPDVGEGITEGKLVSWLINEGDEVEEDDNVAEIQTDKAVVEIPTPVTGTVTSLKAKKGETVKLGQVIMVIDDGSKDEEVKDEEKTPKQETSEDNSKEEKETLTKTTNEETTEDDSKEESKQSSAKKQIKTNQNTNVLALPKVRKKARELGVNISEIKGSGKNGIVTLNDVTGTTPSKTSSKKINPTKTKPIETKEDENKTLMKTPKNVLATPTTRRYAREKRVDLSKISELNPTSKITKKDVDNFLQNKKTQTKEISSESSKSKQKESSSSNSIRNAIANKMMESLQNTAQTTIHEEAEVSELVKLRNKHKNSYEDVKITFLPFFIKATTIALTKHKLLNAHAKEEFEEKPDINIGVAVDTKKGLMVPVIQHADTKSIVELAKEIKEIAKKAREGKLSMKDMQGGTFTISSIGGIAGTKFTPILNYPEVGILGIGRIKKEPVISEGRIIAGKTIDFSLTVDHRFIDGADAARFLKTLKTYVTNVEKLLMEMK